MAGAHVCYVNATGGEVGALAVRIVLNGVRVGHRSDGTGYDGGADPFAPPAGEDRVVAFKLDGCRHFECHRR